MASRYGFAGAQFLNWSGSGTRASFYKNILTPAPEPIVFLPTDLSNCAIWFDANNPATLSLDVDATRILSWQNLGDASGALLPNNGTGASGVATINGLNVVQFPATSNMYWYGALTSQPRTSFVVFKTLSDLPSLAVPFLNLWNGEASAGQQLGIAYDQGIFYPTQCLTGLYCIATSNTTNPLDLIQYFSYKIDTDQSNNFIKINGVAQTLIENHAAGAFNTNPIPYTINRMDGSSMDFAELIIYNRALSDPEISQVESYLSRKWNI